MSLVSYVHVQIRVQRYTYTIRKLMEIKFISRGCLRLFLITYLRRLFEIIFSIGNFIYVTLKFNSKKDSSA